MEKEGDFLSSFQSECSDPLVYLEPSIHLGDCCLLGVRTVFDLCKGSSSLATGPLSELYTEGFDNDQIWEEVQLLNEPALDHLSKEVDKVCSVAGNLDFLRPCRTIAEPLGHEGAGLDESEKEESQGESSEDDSFGSAGEGAMGGRREKGRGRRSVVDDRFFKLSEMEQFLEQAEVGEGERIERALVPSSFLCGSGAEAHSCVRLGPRLLSKGT